MLVLETLLWPDEVRAPDFKFLDEDVDIRTQELKMAASLIDTMTEDFDPSLYKDTYREALEALVQAKIEGNEVVRPAGTAVPAGTPAGRPTSPRRSARASRPPRRTAPRTRDGRRRAAGPAKQRKPAGEPQEGRARDDPGTALAGPDGHARGRRAGLAGGDARPAAKRELVLCVHGMSGAATNWTDLMAELAPDFDCAAVDLPGSGFSPPPSEGAGYSVSALAGTVIRLIETLGAPVPVTWSATRWAARCRSGSRPAALTWCRRSP